jgi:hypothetical protein
MHSSPPSGKHHWAKLATRLHIRDRGSPFGHHLHPTKLPEHISDVPLRQWNRGVFDRELVDQQLVTANSMQLQEAGYAGTQLALQDVYARIEQRFVVTAGKEMRHLTSI